MAISNTHQLQEINRNGIYQDSFTCLADPRKSDSSSTIDSTITHSCYIRETDIHLLNFSCIPGSVAAMTVPTVTSNSDIQDFTSPPFAPQSSVSNSMSNFDLVFPSSLLPSPLSSLSSVTTPHSIEQLGERWTEHGQVPTNREIESFRSRAVKICSRKNNAPKLTHVDLKVADSSKTCHTAATRNQQSSTEQKQKLMHLRKQFEEKLRHSSQKLLNKLNEQDDEEIAEKLDTRKEVGAPERTVSKNLDNLKLPLSFELSGTANSKEDKIMLRLKEKLKQQRAFAVSSTSGSHDIISTSSWPERQELIKKNLETLKKVKNKSLSQSKDGHDTLIVDITNSAVVNEDTYHNQQFVDEVACAIDDGVVNNSYDDRRNISYDFAIDDIPFNVRTLCKNARSILTELMQSAENL